MRRPLGDMLAEVVTGLQPDGDVPVVWVRRVELDLPVEFQFRRRRGELELLGELPRWRWDTAFDLRPGRLCAAVVALPAEGATR